MDINLQELYKEREPPIGNTRSKIHYFYIKPNIIKNIYRERQYYDEPKFWNFTSVINNKFQKPYLKKDIITASGFSFLSKSDAYLKCLIESVERYCNHYYSQRFIKKSDIYKNIKHKMIPLESFARYSKAQLDQKEYSKFEFKPTSRLNLTACRSLIENKEYLIPCNHIYLSYPNSNDEPYIQPPISTGVAAGSALSGALLRGIYEIIERDAFMKSYLTMTPSPKINLTSVRNRKIKKLLSIIHRYNYQIICLDLTNEIKIPTVMSIILDRSNIGKAVSVGLKCNLDPIEAIIGSIIESLHTRGWIRRIHEHKDKDAKYANSQIVNRGLFWYPLNKIKKISFWTTSPNTSSLVLKKYNLPSGKALQIAIKEITKNNLDIYWKNLSIKKLLPLNYFVVKVIIPQLYPLTFDDNRQFLKNRRIALTTNDHKLNTYPHPFL